VLEIIAARHQVLKETMVESDPRIYRNMSKKNKLIVFERKGKSIEERLDKKQRSQENKTQRKRTTFRKHPNN
jgi:hypothetical protein